MRLDVATHRRPRRTARAFAGPPRHRRSPRGQRCGETHSSASPGEHFLPRTRPKLQFTCARHSVPCAAARPATTCAAVLFGSAALRGADDLRGHACMTETASAAHPGAAVRLCAGRATTNASLQPRRQA
ncbi:hypothetical protein PsYK624_166560 [Phanerochaete sordida]|uniref:Uncharacterized protein n=1 Tax=Phanerochaete sordida TaxID=48140 RepID=A0A9P3GX47_9APHY|nr:hypothetical protein PsYK624_166560 [Phanerochaete sordida]